MELNNLGQDTFFRLAGHVQAIDVQVCKEKWEDIDMSKYRDYEEMHLANYRLYSKAYTSDTKKLKEIIEKLEAIEKEVVQLKVDLVIEKICFAGDDPAPEEVEYDLSLVKDDKRVDIDMFGLNIATGTVTFPLNKATADLVGVSKDSPTYKEYEDLIARLKKERE